MTNFNDQMSSIMDLKLNHQRKLYTVDLKIHSQQVCFKNNDEFGI